MPRPKTERRKLADLKLNPLQGQLVRPMPEHALNTLARKFRLAEAIDYAIEILPDGTIIDGHQRREAARRAGLTEVDVIVRHDLVADPTGVEMHMIETHQLRKHLDPIDQARHIRRTVEIRIGGKIDGPSSPGWSEAQSAIARQLSLTGRHAQRVLHVSGTPMPVQVAVSAGRLAIVTAVKAAGLPQTIQEQIANAIQSGQDPKKVVAKHLPSCTTEQSNMKAYEKFISTLAAAYAELDGVVEHLCPPHFDRVQRIGTLEHTMTLIRRLVQRERQVGREAKAALAKALRQVKKKRPKP